MSNCGMDLPDGVSPVWSSGLKKNAHVESREDLPEQLWVLGRTGSPEGTIAPVTAMPVRTRRSLSGEGKPSVAPAPNTPHHKGTDC